MVKQLLVILRLIKLHRDAFNRPEKKIINVRENYVKLRGKVHIIQQTGADILWVASLEGGDDSLCDSAGEVARPHRANKLELRNWKELQSLSESSFFLAPGQCFSE